MSQPSKSSYEMKPANFSTEPIKVMVERVFPFGIFVRLPDGTQGYIRRRELSLDYDIEPSSMVKPGQKILAVVINIKRDRPIELSCRAILDRWEEFVQFQHEGNQIRGTVHAINQNMVNVRIQAGIYGFIPRKEIASWPVANPNDVLWVGDTVEGVITKIDTVKRIFTLSIREIMLRHDVLKIPAEKLDNPFDVAFVIPTTPNSTEIEHTEEIQTEQVLEIFPKTLDLKKIDALLFRFAEVDTVLPDLKSVEAVIQALQRQLHKHETTEVVDVNQIVGVAVRQLRTELQKQHTTVKINFATDLPYLKGKQVAPILHTVFYNLMLNAIQQMSGKSEKFYWNGQQVLRIATSVSKRRERILIRVSDNGAGIHNKLLGKIFQPGFSTHGSGGLGLFLSRNLIELLGGELQVEDTCVPLGTTFVVEIPFSLEKETNVENTGHTPIA